MDHVGGIGIDPFKPDFEFTCNSGSKAPMLGLKTSSADSEITEFKAELSQTDSVSSCNGTGRTVRKCNFIFGKYSYCSYFDRLF